MTTGSDTVTWAVSAGAREADIVAAWGRGRAAEVPTGRLWDVVRVVRPIAFDAVRRLQERGTQLGPILEVPLREALEFIVPVGTLATWPPLPGTTCVKSGNIRCPAPHLNRAREQRATCSRRWIVPVSSAAPITDSDELAEAVTAATVRRATAWLGWCGNRRALAAR